MKKTTIKGFKRRFLLAAVLLLSWGATWAQPVSAKEERQKYFPKEKLRPSVIPDKSHVWVFIMAGQSNMAGRGLVEPQDTVPNPRILSLNVAGELLVAKEPLHVYTPDWAGLDCGMAFANELLKSLPDTVSLLLVPTAVGGSPIGKWIQDLPHRGVYLFSNFKEKLAIAERYGEVKGILWHQGESDANPEGIQTRLENLNSLFTAFRKEVGNEQLPIFIGQIGSYSKHPEEWATINALNLAYAQDDQFVRIVETDDLKDKGDKVHFDGPGQRQIGKRFADAFLRYLAENELKNEN